LAECLERFPQGCPTGEVRLTDGHHLPARHVIHAVGPVWHGGDRGEAELLAACHEAALDLAGREGLATLAFPAISCGVYGYPPERAAPVALEAVARGLARNPGVEAVRVVLFSDELLAVFASALEALAASR
jgi:O-acetyl-ADP-ribose deacetylase (regulator of RNase III)